MKLLVVEDESSTASYLKKGLTEHGFVVDVADNGSDGAHLAVTGHYDLVLLDIMLPERSGWEILRDLRTEKETPVLFLTARDKVEDRVKGLELGADDYLVKPFAFSELLARIRALLRRGKITEPELLSIGDMELDPLSRRVLRGGRRIDLTAKEFALLQLLMRHEGEALSRTLIAEQVWELHFDSDTNVVDVAIRRLRAKVDEPFPQRLIHTLRGVGYICEVRP